MNPNKSKISRICCIGAGYVGGPTMAVIADNCPDIKITVVDVNEERIKKWNHVNLKELPVFEPGLDKLIKRNRGKNLFFSTNVSEEIASSDIIFLCVNTPTKKKGIGAGKASDLKWLEICAQQIALFASGHTIVVEKSTVPVRTAEVLKSILIKDNNVSFSVLSNPEFLAEGTAIMDLQNPDRVLIGGEDNKAIESLSEIYSKWVDKSKIIKTNIWSSELSKLAANAFLAQKISSINSISALCEKTGANIEEVANAIGSDHRIGEKFLKTGPGFGGSCFKKDLLNLIYLCEHFELPDVAQYWAEVLKINYWQKTRISKLVVEKLFGTLNEKKIAILGFSFKANTNDTRESAAIDICLDLLEEGSFLAIHDPKVDSIQIEEEFKNNESDKSNYSSNNKNWKKFSDLEDALKGASALIILTEWDEYKNINWIEIEKILPSPFWIFDTRLITNEKDIQKTNLNLWRLGNELS